MAVTKVDKSNPRDRRYYVQVRIPGSAKMHKKVVVGKTEAEAHEAEMRVKLRNGGVLPTDQQTTVREFFPRVLDSRPRPLSTQSRRTYERHLRLHIYPALGDVKVSTLTTPMPLQTFFLRVEVEVGAATRHAVEGLMRLMLKRAVKERLLMSSPLEGEPFPGYVSKDGPTYAPETEEVLAVREYAAAQPERWAGDRARFLAIIDVLFGTGVRIGELLALAAEDLNELTGMLTVRRQVIYHPKQGFTYGPIKTAGHGIRERSIPLAPFVLAALKATLSRNGTRAITAPWERPESTDLRTHNLIFHRLTTIWRDNLPVQWNATLPVDPSVVRDRLALYGRRVELPGRLHPHSYRHTYTQILDDARVPSIVVDYVTGHKPQGSLSKTVYGRVTKKGLDAARAAMQEAWDEAVSARSAAAAAATTPLRPAVGS